MFYEARGRSAGSLERYSFSTRGCCSEIWDNESVTAFALLTTISSYTTVTFMGRSWIDVRQSTRWDIQIVTLTAIYTFIASVDSEYGKHVVRCCRSLHTCY